MATKTKSGRTIFNRVARLLSEMYDINYKVVLYYYNHFDKNVTLTKYHLKQINQAGNELEFINEHNNCY